MAILVTGSSGFIGGYLISLLRDRNYKYYRLFRGSCYSNIVLPERVFENVIHLAGLAHISGSKEASDYDKFHQANCEYALSVAKAAVSKGLKRFVFVSSASVYGLVSSENAVSESNALSPVDSYGKSKLNAEIQLRDLSERFGFELVVVRPSLVYGPEARGNIGRLLQFISTTRVIPFSVTNNYRSIISVNNLVDFLITVSFHPNASGITFNVAEPAVSTRYLIHHLALGMNRSPKFVRVPRFIWSLGLKSIGKSKIYHQLFESLVFDSKLALQQLSWVPPYDTVEELQSTGKLYLESK